ncbi:MAG: class I SAM-dependent methyltransferase [Candidatus Paceibacterota bacterium]
MEKIILKETRSDLAKLFQGKGAEIGVEQGMFSEVICQNSPGVKLYCVDAWAPYRAYVDHRRKDKLERFYWRTRKRLHKYGCKVVRKPSMEAVKDFENQILDFVYIDANHSYEFVKEDLREWAKKVKPGGIVSGHDYKVIPSRKGYYDVIRAVDEYCIENGYDLYVYAGEEFPSWMFYKR